MYLISDEKNIPENLKEIPIDTQLNTVGYNLYFNEEVEITLDEIRLRNAKISFWFNILRNIERLYNNSKTSFQNLLDVYDGLKLDLNEFKIKNMNGETIIEDYFIENLNDICEMLKISEKVRCESLQNENFETIINKFILNLRELEVFPKEEPSIPDIVIYTDGAAEPNPGYAGAGVYILLNDETPKEIKKYLGIKTNTQAEYWALYIAFKYVGENYGWNKNLQIYSDYNVMVYNIRGEYYVHDRKIKSIYRRIKNLKDKFIRNGAKIEINHIYGRENDDADRLSREAAEEGSKGLLEKFKP